MRPRYKVIDTLISDLRKTGIEFANLPIDICSIIEKLKIHYKEEEFGSSLSGAAMIDGRKKIISVNSEHSDHRKRFTAAHELGHILLHQDQSLSVDIKPITFLRDDIASTGQEWREIEANHFAAGILMPKDLVESELSRLRKKFSDEDELISALAEAFDVSPQAMGIRLGTLKVAAL